MLLSLLALVAACDKKAATAESTAAAKGADKIKDTETLASDILVPPVVRDIPDWPAHVEDVAPDASPVEDAGSSTAGDAQDTGGAGGGAPDGVGLTNTKPDIMAKLELVAQREIVKEQKTKVKKAKAASDELVKIIRDKKAGMSKREYRKWRQERGRLLLQMEQQQEQVQEP